MSRIVTASSLTLSLVLAFCQHGCGRTQIGGRSPGGTTTILDDNVNVQDATAFGVATKAEIDSVFSESRVLADLTVGRLFDFDESLLTGADVVNLNDDASKPVFCQGEAPLLDEAKVETNRLTLRYEADVTSCAQQPATSAWLAGNSIQVDKQIAAIAVTFACSSRNLDTSLGQRSVRAIMAAPASFACSGRGDAASSGRAWRFVARTEGRYAGPRSEVPVEQRYWRGYDAGENGQPCVLQKGPGGVVSLGACRAYERSESRNLVDDSRLGRVLLATATARRRSGNLFADGSLNVRFNGWTGTVAFAPQDTDIKVNMTRPSGECAGFVMRPVMANFEPSDCR
ncbi:MAG: hypothetical protein RIQ81_2611 [Pseudomonadota bacterium]